MERLPRKVYTYEFKLEAVLPLRSEDIGWASLSFISGSLSNNSSEVIVLLNCWDRRPGEGYPARLIRDSFIYRRGGAWSLR